MKTPIRAAHANARVIQVTGYNIGSLVVGRIYHDCGVETNEKMAVSVYEMAGFFGL